MAPSLVVDMIRLFSFNIDFQRDIREGDQLEVLYSRRFDGRNQLAEEGDILYAALTNRGKDILIGGWNTKTAVRHFTMKPAKACNAC